MKLVTVLGALIAKAERAQPLFAGLVPEKKVVRRADGSTFTQTFHVRPPEAKPARAQRLVPRPADAPSPPRREPEPEPERPPERDPRQGALDFEQPARDPKAPPSLDWPTPERQDAPATESAAHGASTTPHEPVRAASSRVRAVGKPDLHGLVTLESGEDHPLMPAGIQYKVPKASLQHHVDEMHHRVRGTPNSGHGSVDEVIRGTAQFLGRGNDGMVFRAGDEVVKVGIVTPYHAHANLPYRTPREAADRLEEQVRVSERMRALGVPLVPKTEYVQHDGRGYAIRDYLDIPEKLTLDELDEVQQAIITMHEFGYAYRDEIQVGRTKDGRLAFFDLGSVAKGKGMGEGSGAYADGDFGNDLDRLDSLYRKNGQTYKALGGIGLERDLRQTAAYATFVGTIRAKYGDDHGEGFVPRLENLYHRAVKDAKRRLAGDTLNTRLAELREHIDFALKELDLPEDTIAKARGKPATLAGLFGDLIPTQKVVRRKTGRVHTQTFHTRPVDSRPSEQPTLAQLLDEALTARTGGAYDPGGGQTMTSTQPLKWTRADDGAYEAATPDGGRYRIEAGEGFDNGVRGLHRKRVWGLYVPDRPDYSLRDYDTLAEAKAGAAAHAATGSTRESEPEPPAEPEPAPARPTVTAREFDIHETKTGWRIEQTHESFASAGLALASIRDRDARESNENGASIVSAINWHPATTVGTVIVQALQKVGPPEPKPAAVEAVPEHPRVVLKGKKPGYRLNAVIVSPDGTMTRGDTDLTVATRIRTISEAAHVLGMTRAAFIAARDAARDAARAADPDSTVTVSLPARFYEDHESRGLPSGRVLKRGRNRVRVALDREAYDDLLSDARHYADDDGPQDFVDAYAIRRSAAATIRALEGVTPPEPGEPTPEPEPVPEDEIAAVVASTRQNAERIALDDRPRGDPATMPTAENADDDGLPMEERIEYATGYAIGYDHARDLRAGATASDIGALADRLSHYYVDEDAYARRLPRHVLHALSLPYSGRHSREAFAIGIQRALRHSYQAHDRTVLDALAASTEVDERGRKVIPSFLDALTALADAPHARAQGEKAARALVERGRTRPYPNDVPRWINGQSDGYQAAFRAAFDSVFANLPPFPDDERDNSEAHQAGARFARKFAHEFPVPADATRDSVIDQSHAMYWEYHSRIPKRIRDSSNDDFLFTAGIANALWSLRGQEIKPPKEKPQVDPAADLPNADELRAEHARAVAAAAAVPKFEEPEPPQDAPDRGWERWYGQYRQRMQARAIPPAPITLPHTPSQAKTFRHWWQGRFEHDDAETHEIKRLEFTSHANGRIYVHVEVGRKNDEGTMAALYARDRYMLVLGKSGGIESYDGKKWVKGRNAYYTRMSR